MHNSILAAVHALSKSFKCVLVMNLDVQALASFHDKLWCHYSMLSPQDDLKTACSRRIRGHRAHAPNRAVVGPSARFKTEVLHCRPFALTVSSTRL